MRIGINTRNLLSNKLEGFGQYTLEITKRICQNHPEHEFYLFFDRSYDPKYVFSENVTPIVLFPPTRHPFLYVIWFEFSLKRALRKHKVDLFWSPDGFCSLGSNVPQIATIHDLNFEHNPKDLPWIVSKYFRFFFPKFARKAKHIITVSEYSKNDIHKTYGIPKEKIKVIYNGSNDAYHPIEPEEQQTIRNKYADGKPFFLFVGSLHPRKNVKRLIEAFDIVSKKNAEIRLVIVGSAMWKDEKLPISKESENRIIFTGHLEKTELTKIMASALALTYVPYFEGFGIPLVEAMNCGTPILAANATCLPEVAGDAAIYCDPFNVEDIANGMLILLNNGNLRNELKEKGLIRGQIFSWDKAYFNTFFEIESNL
ncbi:MAG: glycosyltransferase family 4 protein [Crocinitomicaceae bacterium]